MTNDKEQKLKAAAEKSWEETNSMRTQPGGPGAINPHAYVLGFKIGAKSEAAREYWASEQAKEIERLKEEKEQWIKTAIAREKIINNYENRIYKCSEDNAKLIGQITELKSKLEAKAVDVEGLRREFDSLANSKTVSPEGFYFITGKTIWDNVWNFFLPHLQPGKSDAWISVEERFPDEFQEIIFFNVIVNKTHKITPSAGYFKNGKFTSWSGNTLPVTHWMPLPEPPKNFTSNT